MQSWVTSQILNQHQEKYLKLIKDQIKKPIDENNYGRRVLNFFNGKPSNNINSRNVLETTSPLNTEVNDATMHDMLHQYRNGDTHKIALPGEGYIIQVYDVKNDEFNAVEIRFRRTKIA